MEIRLPPVKIKQIQAEAHKLAKQEMIPSRILAQLLGKMNATNCVLPPGPLFYCHLQISMALTNTLDQSSQCYEAHVPLTLACKEELEWWDNNMCRWNGKTLIQRITICRAQEAAKKQRSEMSNTTPGAVFAVKQRRQPATTQFNQQSVACPGCGSKPHNGGRSRCLAYEQICHHCNKVGHFARVCRAKTANAVPAQTAGRRPPSSVSAKPLHGTWTEDLQSHHLSTIKQVATTEPASLPSLMPLKATISAPWIRIAKF